MLSKMLLFDDFLNKKNQYSFSNFWLVDAPLELIWDELVNYKKWPTWCDGLEKIESLDQFGPLQKGNNIRSIWKGFLPYPITFDAVVQDFIRYSFLSFNVTGDLYGEGICHFVSSPGRTTIHLIWNVSPTKLWMKMGSLVAKSVLVENHNHIMGQAITGFTQMISKNPDLILPVSS